MALSLGALFVNHAADILADSSNGLSGPEIVKLTGAYAIDHNVEIPHPAYPFAAPNKRTALAENVIKFPEPVRYEILKAICDSPKMPPGNAAAVRQLKAQLMARYGHLAHESLGSNVNQDLVEQTKHWLDPFPESLKLYNQALDKHKNQIFVRNLLDDLRLALEKLVQELVQNDKSLEKQTAALGGFIKAKGGSVELRSMLVTLIDYYTKYQNTYVKHDDAVIEVEVDFVFEITSSFMKHLVRLA